MVDEFQDTNALQLELIEALGVPDVFLVGDALQSIYGFRHASVEVFEAERARREQAGEAAALTANFRSRRRSWSSSTRRSRAPTGASAGTR